MEDHEGTFSSVSEKNSKGKDEGADGLDDVSDVTIDSTTASDVDIPGLETPEKPQAIVASVPPVGTSVPQFNDSGINSSFFTDSGIDPTPVKAQPREAFGVVSQDEAKTPVIISSTPERDAKDPSPISQVQIPELKTGSVPPSEPESLNNSQKTEVVEVEKQQVDIVEVEKQQGAAEQELGRISAEERGELAQDPEDELEVQDKLASEHTSAISRSSPAVESKGVSNSKTDRGGSAQAKAGVEGGALLEKIIHHIQVIEETTNSADEEDFVDGDTNGFFHKSTPKIQYETQFVSAKPSGVTKCMDREYIEARTELLRSMQAGKPMEVQIPTSLRKVPRQVPTSAGFLRETAASKAHQTERKQKKKKKSLKKKNTPRTVSPAARLTQATAPAKKKEGTLRVVARQPESNIASDDISSRVIHCEASALRKQLTDTAQPLKTYAASPFTSPIKPVKTDEDKENQPRMPGFAFAPGDPVTACPQDTYNELWETTRQEREHMRKLKRQKLEELRKLSSMVQEHRHAYLSSQAQIKAGQHPQELPDDEKLKDSIQRLLRASEECQKATLDSSKRKEDRELFSPLKETQPEKEAHPQDRTFILQKLFEEKVRKQTEAIAREAAEQGGSRLKRSAQRPEDGAIEKKSARDSPPRHGSREEEVEKFEPTPWREAALEQKKGGETQQFSRPGCRLYVEGVMCTRHKEAWADSEKTRYAEYTEKLEDCTFQPQITDLARTVPRGQNAHNRHCTDELYREIEEEIQAACPFQPQLNERSRQLASRRDGSGCPIPAHEKLYLENADRKQRQEEVRLLKEEMEIQQENSQKVGRGTKQTKVRREAIDRLVYSKQKKEETLSVVRANIEKVQDMTFFRPRPKRRSPHSFAEETNPDICEDLYQRGKDWEKSKTAAQQEAERMAREAADVSRYVDRSSKDMVHNLRMAKVRAIFEALDIHEQRLLSMADIESVLIETAKGALEPIQVQFVDGMVTPLTVIMLDLVPILQDSKLEVFNLDSFAEVVCNNLKTTGPSPWLVPERVRRQGPAQPTRANNSHATSFTTINCSDYALDDTHQLFTPMLCKHSVDMVHKKEAKEKQRKRSVARQEALHNERAIWQEKIAKKQAEKEELEMKACTFQPNVNVYKPPTEKKSKQATEQAKDQVPDTTAIQAIINSVAESNGMPSKMPSRDPSPHYAGSTQSSFQHASSYTSPTLHMATSDFVAGLREPASPTKRPRPSRPSSASPNRKVTPKCSNSSPNYPKAPALQRPASPSSASSDPQPPPPTLQPTSQTPTSPISSPMDRSPIRRSSSPRGRPPPSPRSSPCVPRLRPHQDQGLDHDTDFGAWAIPIQRDAKETTPKSYDSFSTDYRPAMGDISSPTCGHDLVEEGDSDMLPNNKGLDPNISRSPRSNLRPNSLVPKGLPPYVPGPRLHRDSAEMALTLSVEWDTDDGSVETTILPGQFDIDSFGANLMQKQLSSEASLLDQLCASFQRC